jgi:3-oxoacyl-(acyl-carrier-protein) synthase
MRGGELRRAQISGLGLVTALGADVSTNIAGCMKREPARERHTLQMRGEAVDVPYRSCPAQPNDGFFAPVVRAVEDALIQAGTEGSARRTMPLFIGSSSYAIGESERLYAQALADDAAGQGAGGSAALAVPLPGFGQVSRFLRDACGLYGPDFLFNTACTASANALLAASDWIASGQGDEALVVGVELRNVTTMLGFAGMQLLAADVMRPFDARRDGLVLGEGCGAIVLRAASPGDDGVFIAGGASSCDTFSISTSNPDGTRIAAVMRDGLSRAGVPAEDIVAIKAHGTASPLNDDAEAAGMCQAFSALPPFFGLKSHFGHTLGACGAIETALVAAALREGSLPPSGGFEMLDERLGVQPLTDSMAVVNGHYMMNFFGFGGNNASVILEFRR